MNDRPDNLGILQKMQDSFQLAFDRVRNILSSEATRSQMVLEFNPAILKIKVPFSAHFFIT